MLHSRSFLAAVTAATFTIGLTACGGGGGAVPSTGGSAPIQPAQTQQATAQMTINIPGKTSSINHRNPKYISESTQSMTIGLVAGGKTTPLSEIDLTPSSPHCSALAGGGTQCNASFVGQAGTATYALSMFSGTGGKGNLLSTGDVQATLVAGQNTIVPIALDGVPATVALVLGSASLPVGTASSTGVFVQAQDASGNIIVGPGGFSAAIGLAITGDTYKTLALSSATVASPGQVVTLNYTGGSNVGSTITPSIGSTAGTAATFAGSGATANLFQTDQSNNYYDTYPYDVAAASASTTPVAAAVIEGELCDSGCSSGVYSIGMLSPTSVTQMFIGDTTDPYSTPAPTATSPPGFSIVHGMTKSLNTEPTYSYSTIALNPAGTTVYYSASFNVGDANTTRGNCSGSEYAGVLGTLSVGGSSTVETIVKGQPFSLRVDPSGNVWFLEDGGSCNGTPFFPSGYGIGEISSSGALITEKDFTAAGLSASYPSDMALSADGSTMYIVDEGNGDVSKIATASLSAPTIITPPLLAYSTTSDPDTVAVAPDNTVAWFDDCDPGRSYYYGSIPGSKSFALANQTTTAFPISEFYSYTSAYADGSFWYAGDEYQTGIGRVSGLSTSAPQVGYYQMPSPDEDGQELPGIAAGSGYIWAVDSEYGNFDVLQYGAPSTGNVAFASHRLGTYRAQQRNTNPHIGIHAINPNPHHSTH